MNVLRWVCWALFIAACLWAYIEVSRSIAP